MAILINDTFLTQAKIFITATVFLQGGYLFGLNIINYLEGIFHWSKEIVHHGLNPGAILASKDHSKNVPDKTSVINHH
jgi:hypothetical protein